MLNVRKSECLHADAIHWPREFKGMFMCSSCGQTLRPNFLADAHARGLVSALLKRGTRACDWTVQLGNPPPSRGMLIIGRDGNVEQATIRSQCWHDAATVELERPLAFAHSAGEPVSVLPG